MADGDLILVGTRVEVRTKYFGPPMHIIGTATVERVLSRGLFEVRFDKEHPRSPTTWSTVTGASMRVIDDAVTWLGKLAT